MRIGQSAVVGYSRSRRTRLHAGVWLVITLLSSNGLAAQELELFPVADADAYAYSYRNWNNANTGVWTIATSGWHPRGGERRAFFRFEVPGNMVVTRAVLRLYHSFSGDRPLTLGVHRVTGPWSEGTNTYHSGQTEDSAGPGELSWNQQPPMVETPSAEFQPGRNRGWVEIDITELVIGWQDGLPNYGFAIRPQGALETISASGWHNFATRETFEEATSPVLILESNPGVTPEVITGRDGSVSQPTDVTESTREEVDGTVLPLDERIDGHPLGLPKTWWVNCNGNTGWLVINYDAETRQISGTLLGAPYTGYLVNRNIVMRRNPGGTEIWEGWIADPQRAAGQTSGSGIDFMMAGTCNPDGEASYPWFAVEAAKAGTITGQNPATEIGNVPPVREDSVLISIEPPPPPVPSYSLVPAELTEHEIGDGTVIVRSNEMCIESMQAGGAWMSTTRPYTLESDYVVSFEYKPMVRDNHYMILYSDGFVFIDVEWGLDVGHVQPGSSFGLEWLRDHQLQIDQWQQIRVEASPTSETFRFFINDELVGTATEIRPVVSQHTSSTQQNDPAAVFFGDPDDTEYRGGTFNRGSGCWRNIRVEQASVSEM